MDEEQFKKYETYLLKQAKKYIESESPAMVAAITELYKVIIR